MSLFKNKIFPAFLSKFNHFFTYTVGKSTDFKRQQLALLSTCEFIDQHLQGVPAVKSRFEVLKMALQSVNTNNDTGLFLEFGVYKGSTVNYIAKQMPGKKIYGFDSFKGLPEYWREGYEKGAFHLKKLPRKRNNVHLIVGWFDQTLPDFVKGHPAPVAFLHVDSDLYSSAKIIFETLGDQIIPGTIIVFDEYFNFPGWQQCEHRAFQEFIQSSGRQFEYICYNKNHEQLAVRVI